jgi:hypothetical protein
MILAGSNGKYKDPSQAQTTPTCICQVTDNEPSTANKWLDKRTTEEHRTESKQRFELIILRLRRGNSHGKWQP